MRDRQTCIECGKLSPETDTNYTLISSQFGWRLARRKTADGTYVVEWRCADCWKTYKAKKDAADSAPEGAPVSGGSHPSVGPRGRTEPPKPTR